MAKTGSEAGLGTAEGALMGRAAHALHAADPVLDDFWAVELLGPEARAGLRSPETIRAAQTPAAFSFALISAIGIAALRYAEDEVERQVAQGVDQYVVLGAGFDTLALRRADLVDRLRVFEVDHPDVQQLKRERIDAAGATPASLPGFVPVDFEVSNLADGLAASAFDPRRRALFSWLNTLPYLTPDGVVSTLDSLRELAAPGSRLVANYIPAVPLSDAQAARMEEMRRYASAVGEDQRTPWDPRELVDAVEAHGFETLEHLTEDDLTRRYFRDRPDGLYPGLPTRILLARRSG